MSIFGHPVGTCDWCDTPSLPLYEYKGKDVCASCKVTLQDYDKIPAAEAEYDKLHFLIEHANDNY